MKLLSIFIAVLSGSLLLVVTVDLLGGISLSESIGNLINPFKVMHAGEYVVLAGLVIIVAGQQILMIRKAKTNKTKGN
ncbi:MAG: hypothetical protein ABF649_16815 [Bacillus sp. (in: firmicutes)]